MRHKHADLIIAWAEGDIIQFLGKNGEWLDCHKNKPSWDDDLEYRIKPKEPVVTRKYFMLAYDKETEVRSLHEFNPDLENWYMYIEYHDGEPVNAVFAKDVK